MNISSKSVFFQSLSTANWLQRKGEQQIKIYALDRIYVY